MKLFSIQNHTTYSILSGVKETEEWIDVASKIGYEALAITEKNNLSSSLKFQEECKEKGIEPIFGVQFDMTSDILEKDKDKGANLSGTLLFYAKNQKGWENLITLTNISNRRNKEDKKGGFYYRPRMDLETVLNHKEGLVCVIPALYPYQPEDKDLSRIAYDLNDEFGEDFYIGYNPFEDNEQDLMSLPYKKIFTFNCHYPKRKHEHLYDIVRKVDTSSQQRHYNLDLSFEQGHLPTKKELQKQDIDNGLHSECLKHLHSFREKCSGVEIPSGEFYIPEVELDDEVNSVREQLVNFIFQGLKDKVLPEDFSHDKKVFSFDQIREIIEDECGDLEECFPSIHLKRFDDDIQDLIDEGKLLSLKDYIDQVEYEVGVVDDIGYLDYFLIINDVCKWADEQGIERGPARGSAAGSLVSFILNITKVDPMFHDLLFERFLNPDRQDMPDIDLDFEKGRRDEVKQYLEDKYGKDRVAEIGTFSRMKVKNAIKLVAMSYGYGIPDNDGNIINYKPQKLDKIMANLHTTQTSRGREELEELKEYKSFHDFYKKHENWFENVVMPLQETIVGTGKHAAGMIVTDRDLDKTMPCFEYSKTKKPITQYKDSYCEKRGYVKFDFLGLKNVDKVAKAKRFIDEDVPEVEEISLHDQEAIDIFQNVETEGIFQFLTWSQKNFLKELKPSKFDHLTASVALIRPGPQEAGFPEEFKDVRHGKKQPDYPDESLVDILKDTNGVFIFQEQIMKMSKIICDFSGSEADYLRKTIGKKKVKELEKWREKFIEDGVENGYDEDFVTDLWNMVEGFGGYGFNKSHSVSYTLLSFYQAWIKSRYPTEFWAAVMSQAGENEHDDENIYDYKNIAERQGIEFVFPNIKGFAEDFHPASDQKIYWPITALSGVGEATAKNITKSGERHSYESMEEMLEEVNTSRVHAGVIKTLIKAGFFDPIYDKPEDAVEDYYDWYEENYGKKKEIPYELVNNSKKDWQDLKNDSYGMIVDKWKDVAPFSDSVMYFPGDKIAEVRDDRPVMVGGEVDKIVNKKTKYGDDYAKIYIKDAGEELRVMCWSDFWTNAELDKRGRRPRKGDLIQVLGIKKSWSPSDSDRRFHQITLNKEDPTLIKKIEYE